MKIHELKTDPKPYDDVVAGKKTFEIRKNDRDYRVGDLLHLKRTAYTGEEMATEDCPLNYTGEELLAKVKYILTGYGLEKGWCIMSIQVLMKTKGD